MKCVAEMVLSVIGEKHKASTLSTHKYKYFFSRTARLVLAWHFATPLRPEWASYARELARIVIVEGTQVFVINCNLMLF